MKKNEDKIGMFPKIVMTGLSVLIVSMVVTTPSGACDKIETTTPNKIECRTKAVKINGAWEKVQVCKTQKEWEESTRGCKIDPPLIIGATSTDIKDATADGVTTAGGLSKWLS